MSAKEMFRELGYELCPSFKSRYRYEKETDNHIYHFIFNEKRKIFSKLCDFGKTHICFEEIPAIIQQIDEIEKERGDKE